MRFLPAALQELASGSWENSALTEGRKDRGREARKLSTDQSLRIEIETSENCSRHSAMHASFFLGGRCKIMQASGVLRALGVWRTTCLHDKLSCTKTSAPNVGGMFGLSVAPWQQQRILLYTEVKITSVYSLC